MSGSGLTACSGTWPERHLMSEGRLILVTGIPRTGIGDSLKKYKDWAKRSIKIIRLEDDFICKEAAPLVAKVFPGQPADLPHLLSLPKPCLPKLWRQALAKAIEEVKTHVAKGIDVFLTFHACWYHIGTREYTCCVDLQSLREMQTTPGVPKVHSVITLIDDIYDVKSRLSEPGGLCSVKWTKDLIVDGILKLLLILDWRAFEAVVSEKIAEAVGPGPCYTVAVKHRLDTFDKLLTPGLPKAYLAHSISQVRKLLSRTSAGEQARAEAYQAEVEGVASELRPQKIVLFEPTTIDELRFASYGTGDDRKWLPILTKRWQPPNDNEILWTRPVLDDEPFGPEPESWGTSGSTAPLFDEAAPVTPRAGAVAALMAAFEQKIRKQINARDHQLVQQSDFVIGYRPFFDGHEAGGVEEELDFHDRLKEVGIPRTRAVVYHPPSDDEARIPQDIAGLLCKWQGEKLIVLHNSSAQPLGVEIGSAIGKIAAKPGVSEGEVGKGLQGILRSAGRDMSPAGNAGALGGEYMLALAELLCKMGKEILRVYGSTHLDSKQSLTVVREVMDPSALAKKAMKVWTEDSTILTERERTKHAEDK